MLRSFAYHFKAKPGREIEHPFWLGWSKLVVLEDGTRKQKKHTKFPTHKN